jgi:uncharacterized protein (TIGR01244 family)
MNRRSAVPDPSLPPIPIRGTRALLFAAVLLFAGALGPSAAAEQEQAASAGEVAATATPWAELLPNGREPLPGIVTGGQPTLEQFEEARAKGFRMVINLRTPSEPGPSPEEIQALGLAYRSIPVAGADGLTEDNARALATALEEAKGPVIVHCGSGNRVGALFALKAFALDGKSPEEALALGKKAGLTHLEPAVRQRLGLPPAPAEEQ